MCILPVLGLISSINASVYVDLSLAICLQSRTFAAMSLPLAAKSSRISAPVAYEPVFVFFPPGRDSLSKRISPNCLGDAILNSPPANL